MRCKSNWPNLEDDRQAIEDAKQELNWESLTESQKLKLSKTLLRRAQEIKEGRRGH